MVRSQNVNLEHWEMVFEAGIDFAMLDGPFWCQNPHFLPCVLHRYLDQQTLNLRPRRQNFAQSKRGWWGTNSFSNKDLSLAARINEHPWKYRLKWSKEQVQPTHRISLSHFGGLSHIMTLTSNRDIKICPFLWYSDQRHQGVYIIMLILFHLQHTIQLKPVLKMICVYIYIDRLHI